MPSLKRYISGKILLISSIEELALLYIFFFTWGLPGYFDPKFITKAPSSPDMVYACVGFLPYGSSEFCNLPGLMFQAFTNTLEAFLFYLLLIVDIPFEILSDLRLALKDFVFGSDVLNFWALILVPILVFVIFFLFCAWQRIENKNPKIISE
jgi:hypothetical protein